MEIDERIRSLEERIAFLERHVEAQDAEMLDLSKGVRRLMERVSMLEGRVRDAGFGEVGSADERPPHY